MTVLQDRVNVAETRVVDCISVSSEAVGLYAGLVDQLIAAKEALSARRSAYDTIVASGVQGKDLNRAQFAVEVAEEAYRELSLGIREAQVNASNSVGATRAAVSEYRELVLDGVS